MRHWLFVIQTQLSVITSNNYLCKIHKKNSLWITELNLTLIEHVLQDMRFHSLVFFFLSARLLVVIRSHLILLSVSLHCNPLCFSLSLSLSLSLYIYIYINHIFLCKLHFYRLYLVHHLSRQSHLAYRYRRVSSYKHGGLTQSKVSVIIWLFWWHGIALGYQLVENVVWVSVRVF